MEIQPTKTVVVTGSLILLEPNLEPEPPGKRTEDVLEWMVDVRTLLRQCNDDKQNFREELLRNKAAAEAGPSEGR